MDDCEEAAGAATPVATATPVFCGLCGRESAGLAVTLGWANDDATDDCTLALGRVEANESLYIDV